MILILLMLSYGSVLKFQNSCALKHKYAVSYLENNRWVVFSYSIEEIA